MTRPALHLSYCDHYHFPLPSGHKFPLAKYRLLREDLSTDERFRLWAAELAEPEDIQRVHDHRFIEEFLTGTLPPAAMRRIGFPASPELVKRTLASVGGTLGATRAALESGFGGTLAGGTHHAYRNEGSGFCVFNDLAIAVAWARAHYGIKRASIVDLDVHQGDGTASLFAEDPEVFTLSLHGERNFPFRKQHSRLDVPLRDGTADEEYLAGLRPALEQALAFGPDMVLFQAGVDALKTDRLGRLALTPEGMARRDALVISQVRATNIPLVIALGGGYSDPIEHTVRAHAATFRTAADYYCRECK